MCKLIARIDCPCINYVYDFLILAKRIWLHGVFSLPVFCVVSWSWLLRKERVREEIVGGGERWKWKNLPNVAKQSVETYRDRFLMFFKHFARTSSYKCEPRWFVYFFNAIFPLTLQQPHITWLLLIFLSLSEHQERLLASFFTTVCWKAFQLIFQVLKTCLRQM